MPSNVTDKPLVLIFKHNPKAGGGSILEILKELKPIRLGRHQLMEMTGDMLRNETLNKTLVRLDERTMVVKKDREIGFVISNIREPCSHYLSLWSYGSLKAGQLYFDMTVYSPEKAVIAYGQNPPLFDSEEDISAFRNVWLKDKKVRGLIAKRFNRLYPHNETVVDSPPDQVDCWIFIENFQESLVSCLKQYEREGGLVKWDSPLLSKIVEQLDGMKNRRRLLENYQKDNVLGFGETNPQKSHHSKCSKYFDDSTAHAIENGPESSIYTMFGYEGCCKTVRKQIRSEAISQGDEIFTDFHNHEIFTDFHNDFHNHKIFMVLTDVVLFIAILSSLMKIKQRKYKRLKYKTKV